MTRYHYKELFSIGIEHAYSGNTHQMMTIFPDPATGRLLEKNGYQVKEKTNGLRILAPLQQKVSDGPVIVDPFPPQAVALHNPLAEPLCFHLLPDSAQFNLVTDLSGMEQDQLLYFTNRNAMEDGILPSSVIFRPSPPTVRSNQQKNGYRSIGLVELDPELFDRDTLKWPHKYIVSFQSISPTWSYYFIMNQDETATFEINDQQGVVTFTGTDLTAGSRDTIGLALKEAYTDSKLWLFKSDMAITPSAAGRKGLQVIRVVEELVNGKMTEVKEIKIEHLANPDPGAEGVKVIDLRSSDPG